MTGPFLIVSGDFRLTGGMDRANHALARHLAVQDVELHLVAHHVAEDLRALPNVRCHLVPKPLGSYSLGAPMLDRVGRHWARQIAQRGGRVLVNGGNCLWGDLNWAHYVHAAYRPELALGPVRRAKSWLDRRASLETERKVISRARLIIANSDRTRRDLIALLGAPAERVRTVYYGIDPARFGPISSQERARSRLVNQWDATRPLIAFIGALSDRRKGFDVLFDAWAALCRGPVWDSDLVVLGSGAEAPAWQRRAQEAGLAQRVRFLGFTGDVSGVLAACDLVVHPARYEAYGLGVHEALCRGIPAIVSASAGVAERYPAELHDLLLPGPEDAQDLAQRLRHWSTDRESIGRGMVPFAERLRRRTWDHMAADILDLAGQSPECVRSSSPGARG